MRYIVAGLIVLTLAASSLWLVERRRRHLKVCPLCRAERRP
jgi:hypothetical protein